MKPFDLELAKQGKPICTRDGRKARILCFDFKGNYNRHIAVAITNYDEDEAFETFQAVYPDGKVYDGDTETPSDIMMAPIKKKGWINLYKNNINDTIWTLVSEDIHENKESALNNILDHDIYIGTFPIEYDVNMVETHQ